MSGEPAPASRTGRAVRLDPELDLAFLKFMMSRDELRRRLGEHASAAEEPTIVASVREGHRQGPQA